MFSEKANLYQYVDALRERFSIPLGEPINTLALLKKYASVDIEHRHFNNRGLCGLAMVGEQRDMIVLNEDRTEREQNFDCTHELLHLSKHRNLQDSFSCFTIVQPSQDRFLEWQANEGAAQWLVPYQDFIPRFVACIDGHSDMSPYGAQEYFADYYQTTPQVIRNRINSLSFEIDQYRQGICISEIVILSKRQLDRKEIHPTNYNALCDFALSWDAMIG